MSASNTQELDTTSLAAAAAASAPQEVLREGQTAQQQLQAASSSSPQPQINSAGENLVCQWQGCGERCTSAETLYDHVCERHVGRKSTNNLNLTCAWGQCRTTTVKRDHITSHIRVHVPLKPHKCEFCGKAFKRPQDLKKHVKTHADDSVITRSPEPNGSSRQAQAQGALTQGGDYHSQYYSHLAGAQPASYYGPAIPPPDAYGAHHAGNQYYQPPPSTGAHPGYGPVTYYSAAPQTSYDYETRKRGYDALDAFFGQVKRREFDPINYQAVTRRLFELQGLQLPQIIPSNLNVPAYQPVSAVGGGYDTADPIQSYSLPPMGNVKSREDLTSIDQILEQMQTTIYDNDTHLPQSAQTGSYVTFNTRGDSNSPPISHMSTHSPMHHTHSSISGVTDASTPGLTPSASSYTSGQSPLPQHHTPASNAMYPTLPTNPTDYAAIAASSAATMGSMYDDDIRRRLGGGLLQRAAPSKSDDGMDIERDGSATPPASSMNKIKSKGKEPESSPKDSVIDPALSGDVGTPKADKPEDEQETWLQNLRLIEWMRDFIKKQLETGTFDGSGLKKAEGAQSQQKSEPADAEMTDAHDDSEQRKKDQEQLYPVLRHVEQDA